MAFKIGYARAFPTNSDINDPKRSFELKKYYYQHPLKNMSETFINIFIFCVVLVLYLHIYMHSKTSNDLEIFEMSTVENMNGVLEFLQPTLIALPEPFPSPLSIQTYGVFDVKVRNKNEKSNVSELYLPFCLSDAQKLFQVDTSNNYFSECNHEFLQETGLKKHFEPLDELLKPTACCFTQ